MGMFGNSQNVTTTTPLPQQQHHQQHQQQQQMQQQQNNVLQNMELLLESLSTGSFQNFDLGTWQVFMESMKSADLQNIGLDQNQWQDFAFSFSQYLHQQGVIPEANPTPRRVSPSLSNSSNIMGNSQGLLQVSNPQFTPGGSPLQGSQQSFSSSASCSGSSVHSIPGIKVTSINQPAMVQTRGVTGMDDDDDEEFDWDSLL